MTAAREALDADPALADIPLVVGTGACSTRETIELTKEAAERGANYAMVIAPGAFRSSPPAQSDAEDALSVAGYFAGALGKPALKQFFVDVAEASPIPVRPLLRALADEQR